MALGDRKQYKSRGGGSSQADWDRWERQSSERQFDKVKYSDDPVDFLNGLNDESLVELYDKTNAITRYGVYDWQRIVRLLPEGEKEGIVKRVSDARKREQDRKVEDRKERQRRNDESRESLKDEARLTSGYIHSEIAQAIRYKEVYGMQQGDWLDDPVAAVTGQGGFGEEVRYSTGIRLEVNMALDCSNSMYYNNLNGVAVNTFRDMYLALNLAASQLPDDSLTVNAWLWAKDDDGKRAYNISTDWSGDRRDSATEFGKLEGAEGLPDATMSFGWSGEDTWLYPLLEKIEDWEQKHGDPGAFRLDIVISDGVLEHPTDARKCDEIQERRNGNLQSVMLNFLPMEDWGDYRVPNRFVQYEATVDNIGALMRSILGDWVVGVM